MVNGKVLIEELLKYAETFLHLNVRDTDYIKNLLLREFNLDAPLKEIEDLSYIEGLDVPDTLVEKIIAYASENKIVEEGEEERFATYIMGILSPLPSKVNEEFYSKKDINESVKYLYDLSIKNDYVKKTAIAKNLKWDYVDGSRTLEITVNLSKPEKNNKDIAKLLTAPKTEKYPECLLCKENEGFKGTFSHPARGNIRTVSITMNGEPWFFQYSPYAYFNEHMIAISENHTPMKVNEDTIDKVLDFVDQIPVYMIGSNASLPLIGGSILNHEHFQGGRHLMPMHRAGVKESFNVGKVKVSIVDWYNSAIRLESEDRKEISAFAKKIVSSWENYSDEENFIFANTDGVPHNSCSPIARKEGDKYIIDIILRNNITTEEYPEGVFHAHPEYHNIKREGIGLIEAMGLFILPGRLKKELEDIEFILQGAIHSELHEEDNPLNKHRKMIRELADGGMALSPEEAKQRVNEKVGEICKNILINTAVFKEDEKGVLGFRKFLNSIGVN